jgi:hypothetical protein
VLPYVLVVLLNSILVVLPTYYLFTPSQDWWIHSNPIHTLILTNWFLLFVVVTTGNSCFVGKVERKKVEVIVVITSLAVVLLSD